MIQETQHEKIAAEKLKEYSFSLKVSKELGEPLVHHPGMKYLFWMEGNNVLSFLGFSTNGRNTFLRYAYTHKDHRRNGYFVKLLEEMEEIVGQGTVKATSTMVALDHYLKRGYKVTKKFKNYAKIEKQL